jgi:hypothetical protein
MPSGFKCISASAALTDLDNIFAARTTTARSNTGFKVGSQDLSVRYETSIDGSTDIIGFNTFFKSGSTDLRYLFQGIGQLPTPTPTPTPTLTPTPTPTLTPTPTSTSTPTPTSTSTPTPTPSLPTPITYVDWVTSPNPFTGTSGQVVNLQVTSDGGGTKTYEWYSSSDNATWGNPVAINNSDTYNYGLIYVTTYYLCVVKNGNSPAGTNDGIASDPSFQVII